MRTARPPAPAAAFVVKTTSAGERKKPLDVVGGVCRNQPTLPVVVVGPRGVSAGLPDIVEAPGGEVRGLPGVVEARRGESSHPSDNVAGFFRESAGVPDHVEGVFGLPEKSFDDL